MALITVSLWRRAATAAAVVGATAVVIALSVGGSAGSRDLFLAATSLEIAPFSYAVSTMTLLALVGLWAGIFIYGVLRRQWVLLGRLVLGGAATTAAYGLSELLKSFVNQQRPCITYDVLADCPPAENWSFPSNHTVIAVGLAVAICAAVPRWGWVAVPLAVIVGFSRVFAGHHYPHDVVAGAALGVALTTACVLLIRPTMRS